ncbi:MAG: hypothetical protein K2O44_00735 [Clostridia bacterium]|nr:hypothetical protein [Clostridia bacterium]
MIMSQKRFEEYFAKVVLESCFPDKFVDLHISDKPDLRYKSVIGIEVTNCMPKRAVEAFKLWRRVAKQGEQISPRIIERLEQLKEVEHDGRGLVWQQGTYTDNIDDSPIKHFLKAVEKKVERLNSNNADYAGMESYELFVNSFIFIPDNQVGAVFKRLQELNDKMKKFDCIYLLTNEQKLLIFDMLGGMVYPKYLYARLERIADKAKELYLGVKNG